MSALAQRTDSAAPLPEAGTVRALAALAGPARVDALKPVCAEFHDLSQMPVPDAVLRHGGGLILIEQGAAGWDQLLLMLAVERPSTAVIVLSDQLPAHMVRALSKLEAWDVLHVSLGGRLAEAQHASRSISQQKKTSRATPFAGHFAAQSAARASRRWRSRVHSL